MNENNQYNSFETHPYQNLGGWLLFVFIVQFVGVAVTFYTFINLMKDLNAILPWLDGFTKFVLSLLIIAIVASMAVAIIFAILILKKNTKFLLVYEIATIVSVASYFASVFAVGFENANNSSLLFTLIGFFIWTTYYKSSVRVRTYFGNDKYLRQSLFFKTAHAPAPAIPDVGTLIFCPNCGNQRQPNAHFCPFCGTANDQAG